MAVGAAIPLIAAAVTAAGGIASSAISAKAAKQQNTQASLLSGLTASTTSSKPSAVNYGVLPNVTSPLGDTSLAATTRGRLLGA